MVLEIGHTVDGQTCDAANGRQAREHQGNDAAGSEPWGKPDRLHVLTGQVQEVGACPPRRVTLILDASRLAYVVVLLRNGQPLLHLRRSLDHDYGETSRQMPVDMAVEKPNPRVIRHEAHDEVPVRREHYSIPAHRRDRERGVVVEFIKDRVAVDIVVETGPIRRRTINDLETMPVQVKWVTARIRVVQDQLDDIVVIQNDRVSEFAIYLGVPGEVARGQHRVQRRHLGLCVRNVVQEGIIGSRDQVPKKSRDLISISGSGSSGIWSYGTKAMSSNGLGECCPIH